MVHTESSLGRLSEDDLLRLALDYQQRQEITFDKITKKLSEPRKSYTKLKSDLAITKGVKELFRNRTIILERQRWSNTQYSRRQNSGNVWNTRKY